MLDTNTVSHIVRGSQPRIQKRLLRTPMADLCISAVTEGELQYGLAKRGHPRELSHRVSQFLLRVETLPWSSEVAQTYGIVRAEAEASGVVLGSLDMMIAAHAHAIGATLVSGDGAFGRLPGKRLVQDWTR